MAEDQGQEKTEEPTEKKRRDSREEGQVAFSKELNAAFTLAGMLLVAYMMAGTLLEQSEAYMRELFENLHTYSLDINSLYDLIQQAISHWIPLTLPFGAAIMIVGILLSVFQVGLKISGKAMKPKFSHISPLQGLKRIVSMRSLVEFIKSLFKLLIIGYVGVSIYLEEITEIRGLAILPVPDIITFNFTVVAEAIGKIIVAFVALGVADMMYQRWDHEQKLKMTKQQVKEEYKQQEGDPMIKQRIRQAQRQMSQARMIQEVPKADAVVTNPTHFAVALKYDREYMTAPQVVAKGADFIALRMRAVAQENKVPIIERPPLARELYASVEMGQEIPDRFFKAVAEILALVYRNRRKRT